jgi:DNA-binding transcriptional ArsR family regulator
MRQIASPGVTAADVLTALSDPVRWEIVRQMAEVPELPRAVLESTLPISKPTISYHMKILAQAGLIDVRKEGRQFFYTLNREVLQELVDELWALAPAPRPVKQGRIDHEKPARRRRARAAEHKDDATESSDQESEVLLMTW